MNGLDVRSRATNIKLLDSGSVTEAPDYCGTHLQDRPQPRDERRPVEPGFVIPACTPRRSGPRVIGRERHLQQLPGVSGGVGFGRQCPTSAAVFDNRRNTADGRRLNSASPRRMPAQKDIP